MNSTFDYGLEKIKHYSEKGYPYMVVTDRRIELHHELSWIYFIQKPYEKAITLTYNEYSDVKTFVEIIAI